MTFLIVLKASAQKALARVPQKNRERILLSFTAIARNPYAGKNLKGEHKDFYSVRVWPYRIVYRIHKPGRLAIIARIGHRQGIY